MPIKQSWMLALVGALALTGCEGTGALGDEADPADFEPVPDDAKADGTAAKFDMNQVMADDFFVDEAYVDAAYLQSFFETTPYNTRSWLADYAVNGKSAAQAVIDAATASGLNPIVLTARMQVEKGLISKTEAPAQKTIDAAFGCGCHDGQECKPEFKGFDKQLQCAANVLAKHWNGSVEETGAWRKGVAKKTLDPLTVTPANHASASLYAYTPWVLEKKGGNWLVWNVTRKYEQHILNTK